MIVVFHFLFILLIAWVVFKKQGKKYPTLFWLSFLFKISVGAMLGLVYLYYYTSNDTWLFFKDANALAQLGKSDFPIYFRFLILDVAPDYWFDQLVNSQDRSLFLIKIMSVFSWIGGNSYWVSAAYFSLISFLATWYLFLAITRHFENSELAAALSFLFFPSIIFWSSGLVKETLALSGIYFIGGVFLKFIFKEKLNWLDWILALYSFWVAWSLKYYWAALFGAVILAYLMVEMLSKKIAVIQKHEIATWLIVFISLCGGVSFLHPNFYMNRFLEVLITNHNDFIRISNDHGVIHFYDLHSSWGSVIINAPWALFAGILRPFLWEASGFMPLLASLENLLIAVLLISALPGISRIKSFQLLLFAIMVFSALLCIFLALSTPNFGTLSRYRVGFLPFLIFVISYRNPLLIYLANRFKFHQS